MLQDAVRPAIDKIAFLTGSTDSKDVDELTINSSDIVQLAKLALSGNSTGAPAIVRRLVRSARETDPELADGLVGLLRVGPTRGANASSQVDAVPVDLDSRVPLLRDAGDDVLPVRPILSEPLEAALTQLIGEHKSAELLLSEGLYPTRTALLVGPPGVGKTMSARWLAAELGLPLLVLDLSAVMSSFLGKTGSNLRRVLDYARSTGAVLLLDELDAVAKRRDDSTEVGELKRLVTVLLQEIDAWPEGSLLLAATNHAELLDPAVWRRFETVLELPLPDMAEVHRAIDFHIGDSSLSEDLRQALARVFVGHSISEIESRLLSARRAAILSGDPFEDVVFAGLRDVFNAMNSADRRAAAVSLAKSGALSQRRIQELTGVSRDTLRKRGREEGTGATDA